MNGARSPVASLQFVHLTLRVGYQIGISKFLVLRGPWVSRRSSNGISAGHNRNIPIVTPPFWQNEPKKPTSDVASLALNYSVG